MVDSSGPSGPSGLGDLNGSRGPSGLTSADDEIGKGSKSKGIPKSKEIFRFLADVSVSTDGSQWILTDGGNRSYFTSLDALFTKVINLHLYHMKNYEKDMVTNFVELLKAGWAKCKELAKAIEDDAKVVMGSVREADKEVDKAPLRGNAAR